MNYIIYPSEKGHYRCYYDLISSSSPAQYKSLLLNEKERLINKVKLIVSRVNLGNEKLLFLHGDAEILTILLLKILFRKNVCAIIYYTFEGSSIKKLLKRILIFLGGILGVRFFILEMNDNLFPFVNFANFKKINDPILLDFKDKDFPEICSDTINYLIAGYNDNRKNVLECSMALQSKCIEDGKRRSLHILGELSSEVEKKLKRVRAIDKFEIIITNKRFHDDELIVAIRESNVILAIYNDHLGASSMVLNAIACKRRIGFISVGILKRWADQLKFTCLPKDNSLMSLCNFFAEVERLSVHEQYSECDTFAKVHSKEEFCRMLQYD